MKFLTRYPRHGKSVEITIESWNRIEEGFSVGSDLDGIISQIESLADELKAFREKAMRENELTVSD